MAEVPEDARRMTVRWRQRNVAGGREKSHKVYMSAHQDELVRALATSEGMSISRLMVSRTLETGSGELGRVPAALQILDFAEQIARLGNNVNQIAKKTHSFGRPQPEAGPALHAATKLMLSLDELVRWIMGQRPALSEEELDALDEAVALAGEWSGVGELED